LVYASFVAEEPNDEMNIRWTAILIHTLGKSHDF